MADLRIRWRLVLDADTPDEEEWGDTIVLDSRTENLAHAAKLIGRQVQELIERELLGKMPVDGR